MQKLLECDSFQLDGLELDVNGVTKGYSIGNSPYWFLDGLDLEKRYFHVRLKVIPETDDPGAHNYCKLYFLEDGQETFDEAHSQTLPINRLGEFDDYNFKCLAFQQQRLEIRTAVGWDELGHWVLLARDVRLSMLRASPEQASGEETGQEGDGHREATVGQRMSLREAAQPGDDARLSHEQVVASDRHQRVVAEKVGEDAVLALGGLGREIEHVVQHPVLGDPDRVLAQPVDAVTFLQLPEALDHAGVHADRVAWSEVGQVVALLELIETSGGAVQRPCGGELPFSDTFAETEWVVSWEAL